MIGPYTDAAKFGHCPFCLNLADLHVTLYQSSVWLILFMIFFLARMERGMSRPLKPAPQFKQGKKETTKAFINRVERETQAVINKSRFEDKYDVST